MRSTFSRALICFVISWLEISCSTRSFTGNETLRPPIYVASPTVEVTERPPLILTSQPTQSSNTAPTTPNGTPTFVSIFENPAQITDGKLKLSVRESSVKCHKVDTFIPLVITYENLTESPLTIVDYNIMDTHMLFNSRGQLFPVLSTLLNERITTPYDLTRVDIFNPTSPLLHELPARSSFEISVEYYFWAEMVKIDQHRQGQTHPVPAGQYLLRIVYSASRADDSWEGEISSNQIKICITD